MEATGTIDVFYDGACPFCVREIAWLRGRDRHGRINTIDIARAAFDASAYGPSQADFEAALHARLPDGSYVSGVEAFRHIYRAIGLGWCLAPTTWPGLRWLADRAYATFARNRVRLGHRFGRCDDDCRFPAD